MPLPDAIVKRFDGKAMAVTGYEVGLWCKLVSVTP